MSALILPALVVFIIIYGLIRRIDVYSAFVRGASAALPVLAKLLPPLAVMLAAVGALRASGVTAALTERLAPVFTALGTPPELAPLILIRPFSGSAALSALEDILRANGPDSFIGYSASVMLGSTETIFYTVALYCGAAGVTKTRYAVPAALLGLVINIAAAMLCCHIFY